MGQEAARQEGGGEAGCGEAGGGEAEGGKAGGRVGTWWVCLEAQIGEASGMKIRIMTDNDSTVSHWRSPVRIFSARI